MVEKVYPQRALRAQEILSAAALELAEFGIAAFRPRKVAERLGVSNGLALRVLICGTNSDVPYNLSTHDEDLPLTCVQQDIYNLV